MYSAARMIASPSMSMAASTACSASSEYGARRSRYGSRGAGGGGAIENSADVLDIFPGRSLPGGIPQECCGVVRDDERDPVILVDRAAELADRELRVQQRLRGECPEGQDGLGPDQLELAHQVGAARLHLPGERIAISRRAVLEDVADEDILPGQVNGEEDFL